MHDILTIFMATALWCALHTVLLGEATAGVLRRFGPRTAAWHRLLYNGFAGLTLLPLLHLYRSHPGRLLWAWHGLWQIPRLFLLLAAAALLVAGARAYDNRSFLGLRQLDAARTGRSAPPGTLTHGGVLGRVRHPYYAAGLAVLAAGLDFTTTNVVWRGVFVLYLLVGTVLEERRLLQRFGDDYRDYRRVTPAYLPRLRGSAPARDSRRAR
jgi:protein-S-isoprenylcysteine O-methyltransferase Ste14